MENQEINENQDNSNDSANEKLNKPKKENTKKSKKQVKDLEKELADLRNELLLQIADKQNIVKMFQEDIKNLKKYGAKQLAIDLLPSIDMLKMVVNTPNQNPEVQNYLIGFQMIVNQIDKSFANNGIVKIETKIGDSFNLDLHNAVEQVEDDKFNNGQIVEIISNGYKIYDRVLKHTMVKVAK